MGNYEIIPRAEWGAHPPTQPLTPITTVDGWIVHYVGGPMQQDPTLTQSKAAVYNLQQDAFNGSNGETYIDIPYSFLVDLNGRIFEGRGWDYKNAASGSSNYNGHTWAVCVLMGPGDGDPANHNHLTDEARGALLWLTQEGARRKAGVSYVKGHRDVYATHCPGDECYQYVPFLQVHLHDPEVPTPPPIDWAAIVALAAWQKRCAAKPLREGDRGADVKTMNDLLVRQGYKGVAGEAFGQHSRTALHDFKVKIKHGNTDGTVCGGPIALQLIIHKP